MEGTCEYCYEPEQELQAVDARFADIKTNPHRKEDGG